MSRPLAAACLLACSWTAADAAEIVVRDVVVGLAVRPTDFTYNSSSAVYSASGDDAFASGTGLHLGVRYALAGAGSPIGLLAGFDATGDWYTYEGSQGLTAYGVRGCVGAGWAPLDRLTVLGEVGLGYMISRLELPASSSAPAFSADGNGFGYDLRFTGRWSFNESLHATLSAGWMVAQHELDGDAVSLTLDQSGPYVALGVAWAVLTRPTLLE